MSLISFAFTMSKVKSTVRFLSSRESTSQREAVHSVWIIGDSYVRRGQQRPWGPILVFIPRSSGSAGVACVGETFFPSSNSALKDEPFRMCWSFTVEGMILAV
ncbi:hypothetical protein F2P79_025416 [Pimephales promelas]|nr:hypothetical protein F2P79_025416 [Pimephales promelas]